MNKVIGIVPVNQDPFMVTWDLGRRCNYDCSYCPAHRHDNFSPHASLEELKNTTEFLFEYVKTIMEHRVSKEIHISFTGGEPTVNPNFIEFVEYINAEKKKWPFDVRLSLTTNGAMGERLADAVMSNFDYITVSYHCEAHDNLKKQALTRIDDFHRAGMNLKVNVMFHAEYFEECKSVCDQFKTTGVKFIPRVIGDDPDSRPNFAHKYTDKQRQWFKEFWNIEEPTTQMRPCCGGRTFGTCTSAGVEETKVVTHREFRDWACSVNWFFLHIEQQTDLIFHHQTCQARFDNQRGPIGRISSWRSIVANLRTMLEQKVMPVIVCPNKLCGCGLCVPKHQDIKKLVPSLTPVIHDTNIFEIS